jgi:hypothetical protein
MHRFLLSQATGLVFVSVAVTLTAVHPFVHHMENGTLDAIIDYVYASSLDAMNRNAR